jgi:TRAP-type C4-dicarboxylate transport system substrate-binding protein
MHFRKTLAVALGAAFAILVGILPRQAKADDGETLKIGTLAPKQSPWGQVFEVWTAAVKKKSDSKLQLQFFYNGQQGDEGAMVDKMKAGQIDGAAVTAVGLSKIYLPILALQLPGALNSWDKLESAQSALAGDFEKGVSDAGFQLVGWGDVGLAHFFTKGDATAKTPDALKSMKPYMWRDDKISPVFFSVVGATPVPLNVPEVLPQLKTSGINALNAPSLAVEQLQWGPELNNVNDMVTGCAIGALVFQSKRLNSLPGDLRTILTDTGAIASKALGQKIKDEDAAAYGRLSGKMNVVSLGDSDQAAWASAFKDTRKRLSQGTFDPALVSKIEGIAGL